MSRHPSVVLFIHLALLSPQYPSYVQQITSMLQSVYGEVGDVAEEEIAAAAIEDHAMGGG